MPGFSSPEAGKQVMCLLVAPHHTILRSSNVRIYATYLQLKCGLRPTTAHQAMQTRTIMAVLANQPEMSGRQLTAIRQAPHCHSALRPAADTLCPFCCEQAQ